MIRVKQLTHNRFLTMSESGPSMPSPSRMLEFSSSKGLSLAGDDRDSPLWLAGWADSLSVMFSMPVEYRNFRSDNYDYKSTKRQSKSWGTHTRSLWQWNFESAWFSWLCRSRTLHARTFRFRLTTGLCSAGDTGQVSPWLLGECFMNRSPIRGQAS